MVWEDSDEMNNRLRVLRAEYGWSQAELGGRLGVFAPGGQRDRDRQADPSLPLAFKIARLFDQPIGDFR